jgi:hypothetical protein
MFTDGDNGNGAADNGAGGIGNNDGSTEDLPLPVIETRDGIRIFKGLDKPIAVAPGRKIYQALMLDRYST